ncbi:hypothetical protein PENSPDRAFT_648264 [Peniophora sp. CONT]|nr:hypothetical protein PENSPDRAFT_648264 [Peniophora sp. CONT]
MSAARPLSSPVVPCVPLHPLLSDPFKATLGSLYPSNSKLWSLYRLLFLLCCPVTTRGPSALQSIRVIAAFNGDYGCTRACAYRWGQLSRNDLAVVALAVSKYPLQTPSPAQ